MYIVCFFVWYVTCFRWCGLGKVYYTTVAGTAIRGDVITYTIQTVHYYATLHIVHLSEGEQHTTYHKQLKHTHDVYSTTRWV
jgi:hypothetical protein